LGQALGLQAITDTTQLLNQVVIAHVKVKDDRNEVRTYSASTQSTPPEERPAPVDAANSPETYMPPQELQGPTQQQGSALGAQSKPPWAR